MTAQCVEGPILRHPVVDLACDPERFGEQRLCDREIAFHQGHHPLIDQHHLQAVQVTYPSTETRTLRGRGPHSVKIDFEQAVERPSLEQHQHRRYIVLESGRRTFCLIEQASRRLVVAGHHCGNGCHGQ
ncbi:MAG: hypothetical protein E6I75_28135 [Chloroflexi bacterium]|nr:MAG: hypothetical protein E6I75_28135 [Chloroflexota bacterium]